MAEKRDRNGRFEKGNTIGAARRFPPGNGGRSAGVVRRVTREIAEWADGEFRDRASVVLGEILNSPARSIREKELRFEVVRWLADRAYGRAPQYLGIAIRGISPDSPEGILLQLSGESLPGSEDYETEES
jgi:hypothetical protein